MDKEIKKIVNRVANKNSVKAAKVELAVEIFFANMKKVIQREDMPTVMIHNFGRFNPDEKRIKRRIYYLKHQLTQETITQEEYEKKTKQLEDVLGRLRKQKHIRTKK